MRRKSLTTSPVCHQVVECAGRAIDLWLATSADGRQATAAGRTALAGSYGLSRRDFEIRNHDHVDEAPQVRVSLSHTSNLGAVIACSHPAVMGVGVDVEFADRTLRPGTQRHFLNADDGPEMYANLLTAWVAKEAVFKAIDPHRARWLPDADLLLSRLWLRDGRFGLCGNPVTRGAYCVIDASFAQTPLRIGLAVLTESHAD